jgi:hypothetical protein
MGSIFPDPIIVSLCALFGGATARLVSILWSALNQAATKFLHTDQPDRDIAQAASSLALPDFSPGPPPAAVGFPVSPRSSLPLFPIPCRLSAALL